MRNMPGRGTRRPVTTLAVTFTAVLLAGAAGAQVSRDILDRFDKAVTRLDARDVEQAQVGLEDLRRILPEMRETLVQVLGQRQAGHLKKLRSQREMEAVELLIAQRRELEQHRQHALKLINDTERYFYPYNPPAVRPDKAALYPKVQQDVDRRVAAIRQVWGDEFKKAASEVVLSRNFLRLLQRLQDEHSLLLDADPDGTAVDTGLQSLLLLPLDTPQISVRNVALDQYERARLDRDAEVLAKNVSLTSSATSVEMELIFYTNMYRLMLGRKALAIDDRLVRAARDHCKWMSGSGKFTTFNDDDPTVGTPRQRIQAQGHNGRGATENIKMCGGAMPALTAWIHSSGPHRHLLNAPHTVVGAGNIGSYWCQNFADNPGD